MARNAISTPVGRPSLVVYCVCQQVPNVVRSRVEQRKNVGIGAVCMHERMLLAPQRMASVQLPR